MITEVSGIRISKNDLEREIGLKLKEAVNRVVSQQAGADPVTIRAALEREGLHNPSDEFIQEIAAMEKRS